MNKSPKWPRPVRYRLVLSIAVGAATLWGGVAAATDSTPDNATASQEGELSVEATEQATPAAVRGDVEVADVGDGSTESPLHIKGTDMTVTRYVKPRGPSGVRCVSRVHVDDRGRSVSVEVQDPCPDRHARVLARTRSKWRWEPVVRDGDAIHAEVLVGVTFR